MIRANTSLKGCIEMARSSSAKILKFGVPEPLHEKRKRVRAAAKKADREKRRQEWSANRPKPAEKVKVFLLLMKLANKKLGGMTRFDQADLTGLGKSTVAKHLNGESLRPTGRSIQMWLDFLDIDLNALLKKDGL